MNCTISSPEIATSRFNCDRPPVLVDPKLLKFLQLGVLCKVELVTEQLELDAYEMPVPQDWKTIELIVLNYSREAIEQIIASTPEYQGYRVTDYWQVTDDENPF